MLDQRTDVAVILVGLNTSEFVKNCLESVAKSDWRGYSHSVIYVDNGSKDDSVQMVRTRFPHVHVIANTENLHFTRAANQAASAANSRYHLQLNNDTLVYPDSIALLLDFLESHPEAACVGGRILNPDLSDQWSARRFPTVWNGIFGRRSKLTEWMPNAAVVKHYLYKDELAGRAPFKVDWVPSVYMLIREAAWFAVGGMPPELYYWAEGVFCDRLWKKGLPVWVLPTSKIIHFEGQGGGPRPYRVRRWHIINFHRGAYRFYREHTQAKSWNPALWFTAALLALRATLLLTKNKLSALGGRS